MLILSRLQLGFEAKLKQFGQTDFLEGDTGEVVEALSRIEEHLNQVLDLWEQKGWTIREGTPLALVYDGLEKLFRVRAHFRPGVSDQMKEITELINKHVFGEATENTKKVVARIDALQRLRALANDLCGRAAKRSEAAVDDSFDSQVAQTLDLFEQGKPEVAFKKLAQNVYKFNVPLSQDEYQAFDEAGRVLNLDPDAWNFLGHLVRTTGGR